MPEHLSAKLVPTTASVYQVTWQVVSADGHTFSDKFAFTDAAPVTSPSPSPSATSSSAPASPAPVPSLASGADTDGLLGTSLPLFGIGIPALFIVAVAVYVVSRIRKSRRDSR